MFLEKIKKLGPNIFIHKLLGYEACFTCGIRVKGEKALYEGDIQTPFTVIPYSRNWWYADPLLYTFEGKTVLFMEAYSTKKQKGQIVCSTIVNGNFTKIRPVIEEPFHMSFPNVFEFQGTLYMIPEVEASGGIRLYRCLKFPDQWILAADIKTPVPIVDSVVERISNDDKKVTILASTYDEGHSRIVRYFRFVLDLKDSEQIRYQECTEENSHEPSSYEYRNAGRYIRRADGKFLHCTQTSTEAIYGYSLKFIPTIVENDRYTDDRSLQFEIKPDQVNFSNLRKRLKPMGVHTYSQSKPCYSGIKVTEGGGATVNESPASVSSGSVIEAIDVEYLAWNPKNSYWMNHLKDKLFAFKRERK